MNKRIILARRPTPTLEPDCFALEEVPVPDLTPGDVMVHNIYLSVDPYLRLNTNETQPLGEPMIARVAGVVAESADARWQPGDLVWGFLGWEEVSVRRGGELFRVDPNDGPLSHTLSARGMNGLTAWVGMLDIGKPVPGDTVVVSAGTGSVGSMAGQLARLAGARVVAIVGGERKVRHAVDVLGYHAAVDHRGPVPLPEALAEACPDGVDVYFDNVGGRVLEAACTVLNRKARISVCGAIGDYDRFHSPPAVQLGWRLGSGTNINWYSVNDYMHQLPEVAARMGRLVRDGSLVITEDIAVGIEQTPAAFLGVFQGDNLGKQLVQVRDWTN